MSKNQQPREVPRIEPAVAEGRLLRPRGRNEEFFLSLHAQDRAHERGAGRCVLLAALSRRPVSHLDDGVAVFRSDGFQILVNLETRVVITVLPKDCGFLNAKRRDSGCAAHRRQLSTGKRVA